MISVQQCVRIPQGNTSVMFGNFTSLSQWNSPTYSNIYVDTSFESGRSQFKLVPELCFCCALTQISAVGTSSDKERARKFAEKFNIPRYYDNYQDLVNDEDIDIIYVGTISKCHKETCAMALNAGKPVYCETPMCMNESKAKEVAALAKEKNLFLIEGIWNQFVPVYDKLREELANIGDPKVVTVTAGGDMAGYFEREDFEAGFFHLCARYIGVIPQNVFQREPRKIVATGTVHPKTGADLTATVTLHYENDKFATIITSSIQELNEEVMIYGTKGWMKLTEFYAPSKLITSAGEFEVPHPKTNYELNVESSSAVAYVQEHVRECLQKGLKESPLLSPSDSVKFAAIGDEVCRQLRAEAEKEDNRMK